MTRAEAARRLGAAALAIALLATGCTTGPVAAGAPGPGPRSQEAATGVVQAAAGGLAVDGRPWRFGGYTLPCAQPFTLGAAELGHYLDVVQQVSGANALRVWFFQSNAGPADWGPFDRVVAAAWSRGMRLVPTLTDEWYGACDGGTPGTEKAADWYRDGYRRPDPGHTLSFRDFAARVAAHFAGQPAIAFWQLVNEAQARSSDGGGGLVCDPQAATAALRAFADDMAGVVKSVDPAHLVSLGTIGGSQCGLAGGEAFRYVHAGAVDLCEYHDYGTSAEALPSGPDQLRQRLDDCAALPGGPKPLFVGEAGVPADVQQDGSPAAPCAPWPGCSPYGVSTDTLVRRAAMLGAKAGAALGAGAAGYMVWVKSPFYTPSTEAYAIGDGDPAEQALHDALRPGAPTVTGATACAGGAVVTWAPPPSTAGGVTGYTVTASGGATAATGGDATSATVTGLRIRRRYTFTVVAVGPVGAGPPSEASPAVAVVSGAPSCP